MAISLILVDDGLDATIVAAEMQKVTGSPAAVSTNPWAAGVDMVIATSDFVPTVPQRQELASEARVVWLVNDSPNAAAPSAQRLVAWTNIAHHIESVASPSLIAQAVRSSHAWLRNPPDRQQLHTVTVDVGGGRAYPVHVGRGALSQLGDVIPGNTQRVAVVTQEGIGVDVDPGREHEVFTVVDGEEAKTLDVLGDLASRCAQWGLTRRDTIVSVGGGVVSDLAGYLAASYHRGINVVHVSTTLLGQIDAAIGGKCGVNLPEGKNLMGAFKQPAGVICDIDTLMTLPEGEFMSGMGELAKYHFLGGGRLDRVELSQRVAASVAIKADVVADDETEAGRRAILNNGHTLAHALETALHHQIRHGEAVAVGIIYAAELAHALGRIDAAAVAEHRRVARAYGLNTQLPDGLDFDEVVYLFGRDKKALDGVTFVLDGPSGVEPVVVDDPDLLKQVLHRV